MTRLLTAAAWILATTWTSNASLALATGSRIVPMRTTAKFVAHGGENSWSAPVRSADGRTLYVLSFDPELWAGSDQAAGVDLVLRRAKDKAGSANLLAPSGNWHGLQDYMFAAADLAKGASRPILGEKRTIPLNKLGLVVRITLLGAKISSRPGGDYQLNELDLAVEVENWTP